MTFLTILGITEILYSFRSVLEGKTGKEILCHQDYCSYQTIFFRGGIAGLPLLKTLLGISQWFRDPSFWKVLESFVLL